MKLYGKSQSLMPTVSDAFAVHDAAHELQSANLHESALRLLNLHQLDHVVTDELDANIVTDDEWDVIPSSICVDDEAVSVVGNIVGDELNKPVIATGNGSLIDAMLGKMPVRVVSSVTKESYHKLRTRVPLYSLWLVKNDQARVEQAECSVQAGTFVETGYPRKSGAYKFPVVAQKVGKDYTFYQVHKVKDEVTIFDKHGNEVPNMWKIADKFIAFDTPENAVFECIAYDDSFTIFDVLYIDGVDCTKLQLSKKMDLLSSYTPKWPAESAMSLMDVTFIKMYESSGLYSLEQGSYIIRHVDDVMSDLLKPFWFYYEAGTVRIGTPLPWVSPSSEVTVENAPADRILVAEQNGPNVQIHKDGKGTYLFVAEGGRNRISSFPMISSIFDDVSENFILECSMSIEDASGLPVSIKRVQQLNADLSDCKVTLHAYDLPYWCSDVSNEPMYERISMLENFIESLNSELVKYAYDTPVTSGSSLSFDEKSKRIMNSNWGSALVKLIVA